MEADSLAKPKHLRQWGEGWDLAQVLKPWSEARIKLSSTNQNPIMDNEWTELDVYQPNNGHLLDHAVVSRNMERSKGGTAIRLKG